MSYDNEEKQLAVTKFEEKQVAKMFGDDWAFVKALYPKFEAFNLALLFKMSPLYGLNPINREIYLLFTKQGPQIYVGKVGLTRKLNEAGGFSLSAYNRGFDKEIGVLLDERNNSKLAGKGFYVEVTITHKGQSITSRAYWDEHSPDELKLGSSWHKNPVSMLEKAAFCKGARHLLGINEPAPEEMGLESVSDEENQASRIIEGKVEVVGDAPRTITIWNGNEKIAMDKIGTEATAKAAFSKEFSAHRYFKHPKHFDQHLEKHFGVKHPQDLTWEMLDAMHKHINDVSHDERWYKPEKVPASGWEAHQATKPLFEAKGALAVFEAITNHFGPKLATAPAEWGVKMKDIAEAFGVVYDLPLSKENQDEIFALLEKEVS